MGGPKGSALAILMDVFSGVMTGAAFAGSVASPYNPSRPADVGHFVVVTQPDLFVSKEDLVQRLHELWDSVTGGGRAADVDRIWFPGEREQEMKAERMAAGIPFTRYEINVLNHEAHEAEVEEISVS